MEHIEQLFFSSPSSALIVLLLFVAGLLENIFPPAPGDTAVLLGAFLAARGRVSLAAAYISASMGSVLGYMLLFFVGRRGEGFFTGLAAKIFSLDKIEQAKQSVSRYGYTIVIVNRFLPGVRAVVSIASGMLRLRVVPVLIFASVSTLLWNALWVYAGFSLGKNWEELMLRVKQISFRYNLLIAFILIVLLLVFVYKRLRRKS